MSLKDLPPWNGRVLIDATNPFVETSPKLVLADLGGKGASEIVAALAPGARIVKVLQHQSARRHNRRTGSRAGKILNLPRAAIADGIDLMLPIESIGLALTRLVSA